MAEVAQVNGIIAEEAKRRAALAFQQAMAGNVTQAKADGAGGVTPPAGDPSFSSEGRAGRCGSPFAGAKNRVFFRGGPRP